VPWDCSRRLEPAAWSRSTHEKREHTKPGSIGQRSHRSVSRSSQRLPHPAPRLADQARNTVRSSPNPGRPLPVWPAPHFRVSIPASRIPGWASVRVDPDTHPKPTAQLTSTLRPPRPRRLNPNAPAQSTADAPSTTTRSITSAITANGRSTNTASRSPFSSPLPTPRRPADAAPARLGRPGLFPARSTPPAARRSCTQTRPEVHRAASRCASPARPPNPNNGSAGTAGSSRPACRGSSTTTALSTATNASRTLPGLRRPRLYPHLLRRLTKVLGGLSAVLEGRVGSGAFPVGLRVVSTPFWAVGCSTSPAGGALSVTGVPKSPISTTFREGRRGEPPGAGPATTTGRC
jgi:hypothetical protein